MEILLDVPQILQNPELPNGCEITSLCEVLRYLGFDADKCQLADHYLPRSERWYGADPDRVYMGNPHLDDGSPETGYYCFAGPIAAAARRYLADHGGGWEPVDLTGAEEQTLALRREYFTRMKDRLTPQQLVVVFERGGYDGKSRPQQRSDGRHPNGGQFRQGGFGGGAPDGDFDER